MTDAPSLPLPSAGGLSLTKTGVSSDQLFGRPVVPVASPEVTTLPLRFTGQAGEYFRIWIVNVLLTVVTLGLYSPWARVRTRQYFYGHTWLDGHTFEYTARPIALLRGFLIVGVLFVVYSVTQQFPKWQWVSFVLLGVFGLLYPWLIYRSVKFNAANTVYRGLSFHFHGRIGAAYVAYLVIMATVPFTLGLTYPLAVWMQRRYLLENLAYGTAQARWGKDVGPVYLIFLTALGVSVGLGILAGIVVALMVGVLGLSGGLSDLGTIFGDLGTSGTGSGTSGKGHGEGGSAGAGLLGIGLIVLAGLLYALFLLSYLAIGQYIRAALLKYSLHDLYVGPTLRLQATFNPLRLAWINTSNTVAQVVTLGLLTPWAAVRRTAYLMSGLQVQTIANLDEFSADVTPNESALGEAANEFFDFDLGF